MRQAKWCEEQHQVSIHLLLLTILLRLVLPPPAVANEQPLVGAEELDAKACAPDHTACGVVNMVGACPSVYRVGHCVEAVVYECCAPLLPLAEWHRCLFHFTQ